MNTPREPICVALHRQLPTCDLRALSDQTADMIDRVDASETDPRFCLIGSGVLFDLSSYLDTEITNRFQVRSQL